MGLVEQWRSIRAELPSDWAEARLAVTVPDQGRRARAAALLVPASPGRVGDELRFSVHRSGEGVSAERAETLLRKLDEERLRASLTLIEVVAQQPEEEQPRESLAAAWAEELETLPNDWSDLLCELEIMSSDHLARTALLVAPLNPSRVPNRLVLRFRAARLFGYGASPEMTARCLQRLDEAEIPGRLTLLHILSDTHPVATQGPVWRLAGRSV
jgi:hypothetical protein